MGYYMGNVMGGTMGVYHGVVAIKAVAHKLARACCYILRDQVPFDVTRSFT